MKNIVKFLLCLIILVSISSTVKSQGDSVIHDYPKINLKYDVFRLKHGILDSTLVGYYFSGEPNNVKSYKKAYEDPYLKLYMRNNRFAYKYINRMRTIDPVEDLFGLTALASGVIFKLSLSSDESYPNEGAVIGISAATFVGSLVAFVTCFSAEKKSFLKGVKLYNWANGYS